MALRVFFVVAFILRILNIKSDIVPRLCNKYGQDEVKYYRKLLDAHRKLEKSKLDLEFLMK